MPHSPTGVPAVPRRMPVRSVPIVALAVAGLVVAACGSSPRPSPSGGPAGSPTTSSGSPGPSRPSGTFDPAAVRVELEAVADIPGNPLAVVAPPDGSGRLFVIDRGGSVWIVRDGTVSDRPFLDIRERVRAGGEQGLLGFAFHPAFPVDLRFFYYYTDREGNQVVAEGRLDAADPDRAQAGERILLEMDDFAGNHNGGATVFGPDGMLYVSTGDGGGAGDPEGSGQRLDTLLAKILRLDVDGATEGRAYGIPPDNPFVGRDGAEPEIWLTGLRNPWRISFDRATSDFWIGDVGQGQYEEIDVVRAGAGAGYNFGWNRTEGFHCYGSGESCSLDGLTPPVTEYSHDDGCSVTGGYVYRGSAFPSLVGAYLFGDYCSGNIWAIDAAADRVDSPVIVGTSDVAISSFGEDQAGELYVTDLGGRLLRVVASAR